MLLEFFLYYKIQIEYIFIINFLFYFPTQINFDLIITMTSAPLKKAKDEQFKYLHYYKYEIDRSKGNFNCKTG